MASPKDLTLQSGSRYKSHIDIIFVENVLGDFWSWNSWTTLVALRVVQQNHTVVACQFYIVHCTLYVVYFCLLVFKDVSSSFFDAPSIDWLRGMDLLLRPDLPSYSGVLWPSTETAGNVKNSPTGFLHKWGMHPLFGHLNGEIIIDRWSSTIYIYIYNQIIYII